MNGRTVRRASPANETLNGRKVSNLAQYWISSTDAFIGNLPTFEVRAEVRPAILPSLKWTDRYVEIAEIGAKSREDWILVELYFEWEDEAKGFILGFADQINVIEPKHLRWR
ncbi:hypothetical protein PAE9249_04665 [Paenibacillus sp. CECT 9249]|uniref:WYL domain-containing protein n=1 Tax=Paenibacillus sp. CECT 9249 TaxID=2845385 RepID=UPI001E4F48C9|nr:WYL domain-containing protein [Paenibacillus sp. CECT 9249]CAH0122123.1 hypothetical protein PAE9249_04665 [Paenibacillus sp. CECT 9249]